MLNKQLIRDKLKAIRDKNDNYGIIDYSNWKDDVDKLIDELDAMFYPKIYVCGVDDEYHMWVDGSLVMKIHNTLSPYGDLSEAKMGYVATKMLGHNNYIWCNTAKETDDTN